MSPDQARWLSTPEPPDKRKENEIQFVTMRNQPRKRAPNHQDQEKSANTKEPKKRYGKPQRDNEKPKEKKGRIAKCNQEKREDQAS